MTNTPAPIDIFAVSPTKNDPAGLADDAAHLARVSTALDTTVRDLTTQLADARRGAAGSGDRALRRDQDVHRLTSRLTLLTRFGQDLCLGRMVVRNDDGADTDTVYIGRIGLSDADGHRLLVDWRAPAAEPFFAATPAHPHGVVSRRRYRWTSGRISDYWDEVFTPGASPGSAALDDQSAFLAGLGESRSARMRDVLGTIQADQDAIIRADSRSPLVVDGGPGTGKTVVALHRAAYLLYADTRVRRHTGQVLFIGPHRPYLAYVGDVLPSLGEDGVATCTLADLVPEGVDARPEPEPWVARLKADARIVDLVEPAVGLYEEPPTSTVLTSTPWGEVPVAPNSWAAGFASLSPGAAHNEGREEVWAQVLEIAAESWLDARPFEEDADEPETDEVITALSGNADLRAEFERAWPLLDPLDLVGDLFTVPAYLRRSGPWLSREDVSALQRTSAQAWTEADLPLLDAMRRRVGDPLAAARRRRRATRRAAEQRERTAVLEDMIAADDSEMHVMSMLKGDDLREALLDSGDDAPDPDSLAGPFAHVVVDEAQELTDAQWQMVLARCPSRSLTIVGDRAQARSGFAESWLERLRRVGVRDATEAGLTINYRTPSEVMAAAEPVIRRAVPDANVPTSVRDSGLPVRHGEIADLDDLVQRWLAENEQGTVVVISADGAIGPSLPAVTEANRVRTLTPTTAKGLEFDLVVLVRPDDFGDGVTGAVDRYVAMTRATRELLVLT